MLRNRAHDLLALLRTAPCCILRPGALLLATLGLSLTVSAAERTFDIAVDGKAIANRAFEPRVLRVDKGDTVRLRIVSDQSGELHLHGYRLETRVEAGKPATLDFSAHATGRYRIEWHDGSGAASSSHHGPPLAILEVHPK